MRSLGFAVIVVLACNPDSPGTTATTTGSGTTTGSTAGTTTTGSTGTTAAVTTTGASASEGTTASPTTTTATTSTATTTEPATTTTSTTTGTATTDDTGIGEPTCLPAVGDYGACQTVLGWAFDGVECTSRSGCDCAPDCDKFFPDAVACANSCAAADHCNADRFEGAGIAEPPIEPGDFCDGVYVCPADDALAQAFQQIFGMLTCEPGDFPCAVDGEHCAGLWAGRLGPAEWAKMCAASLLPMSGPFYCTVFGP